MHMLSWMFVLHGNMYPERFYVCMNYIMIDSLIANITFYFYKIISQVLETMFSLLVYPYHDHEMPICFDGSGEEIIV